MSAQVPARLLAIEGPVERAAACVTFIAHTRAVLRAVEALRDESIREVRDRRLLTIDALARVIKVNRATVVEATRKPQPAAKGVSTSRVIVDELGASS